MEGAGLPGDSSKSVQCPECGRTFTTPQSLGAHRARSHGYRRANGDAARPDDQGPVVVEGTPFEPADTPREPDAMARTLVQMNYQEAVKEFLPHLARELERRKLDVGPDDTLTAVFLTLFLDAN